MQICWFHFFSVQPFKAEKTFFINFLTVDFLSWRLTLSCELIVWFKKCNFSDWKLQCYQLVECKITFQMSLNMTRESSGGWCNSANQVCFRTTRHLFKSKKKVFNISSYCTELTWIVCSIFDLKKKKKVWRCSTVKWSTKL